MKNTTQLTTSDQPADGPDPNPMLCRTQKAYLLWFAIGALVGVLAPTAYLICGGDDSWHVPRWALMLFYPGFVVGNAFYENIKNSHTLAQVIGCATVSLSYGILAAALLYVARFAHKPGLHANLHANQ